MTARRFLLILLATPIAMCGLALSAGFGCAAWLERHVDDAAIVQARIAGMDLPADYSPAYGLDLGGARVAGFDGADGRSHLVLAEMQGPVDAIGPMPWVIGRPAADLQMMEMRPAVVRGEPATIVMSTGHSGDGLAIRVLRLTFAGRNGPAILVLNTPESTWDEGAVDALIESLR